MIKNILYKDSYKGFLFHRLKDHGGKGSKREKAKEYNFIAAKTVKKKVSERKTAVFNLLFTVDYFMYRPVICPCMI